MLVIPETELSFRFNDLVLPEGLIRLEYPLKTLVKNVSLIELSDPINLTISELPIWENEFVERENESCLLVEKRAGVSFTSSFTEDSQILLIRIRPVEVVNCTSGELRLFKTIRYAITYEAYSPVLISSLEIPNEVGARGEVNISVLVKNIIDKEVNGTIYVESVDGNYLTGRNISIAKGEVKEINLTFLAPVDEGYFEYRVVYKDTEVRTFKRFGIDVKRLKAELISPLSLYETQKIYANLVLENRYPNDLEGVIEISLNSENESYNLKGVNFSLPAKSKKDFEFNASLNLLPGSYNLITKIYSEATLNGKTLIKPLLVKELGKGCDIEGELVINDTNFEKSLESYCSRFKIISLISLRNLNGFDRLVKVSYKNLLARNIKAIRVLDRYGELISYLLDGNEIIFEILVEGNSEEQITIEISLFECESGGILVCGREFCCGSLDGLCPEDFENVSCLEIDPDCWSGGGIYTCERFFACGEFDGLCPEDFENVSCLREDPDCCERGFMACNEVYCCGKKDGICPLDFGVICEDPDCCSNGGIMICDKLYCCGEEDGLCPEYFGVSCSFDPEC